MGPIVHKTYMYKDKDKIYSLSLTGAQIIFMSLSPGVERPNIDQFVPILDQAGKIDQDLIVIGANCIHDRFRREFDAG